MNDRFLGFGVAVLLTGCVARPIEVGMGADNATPRPLPPPPVGTDNYPLPRWPAPDACAEQSNLPIAGVWNGYFGRFQNPTVDFRVDIRGASSANGLCGTVTFKPVLSPPPPPADPEVMYPPQDDRMYHYNEFSPPLIDGFAFTILGGRAQGSRAQIRVASRQPWQGWCELQPSYPVVPNPEGTFGYSCIPSLFGIIYGPFSGSSCVLTSADTNETFSVNCGRFYLCQSVHACECNAARCVASQNADIILDLDFLADEATGSILGWYQSGDVLLVRAR